LDDDVPDLAITNFERALTPAPPPAPPAGAPVRTRSDFVRDVLALQVKLIVGSFLAFLLGPATLAAAFLDLIFKSGSHGSRFYQVLDWGRRCDDALGLYAALRRRHEGIDVEDGTSSKHRS
jgi:hypothetical protein